MTVGDEFPPRVFGGQFGLDPKRFTKVLSSDAVLSKVLWTKTDRLKVLKILQSILDKSNEGFVRNRGVDLLLALFGSISPLLSLFPVSELDLLLALARRGSKSCPLLQNFSNQSKPAKKRRKSVNYLFLDCVRSLYRADSNVIFELLSNSGTNPIPSRAERWLFGLAGGALDQEYFLPYLHQAKVRHF